MIICSFVEVGCAEVPAIACSRISLMNVIGCSCVELCCMPGISCIESSGFGVGVGLAPYWGCKGSVLWPKTAAENRRNKIISTDTNEFFISIPRFCLSGVQNVGPQVFHSKMETPTEKCRRVRIRYEVRKLHAAEKKRQGNR